MRLLHCETLELRQFSAWQIPEYVILSHTWGEEEVTLKHLQDDTAKCLKGYQKLRGTCDRASQDEYEWVWIDTCCIDGTSSAELQETINSMFSWYERASICYVYLADIPNQSNGSDSAFGQSRWFTRGWTLQELLAPIRVEFYADDWTPLGTKLQRAHELSVITGIPRDILSNKASVSSATVAERMSWAAHRSLTREEDIAYCLLGLFQVNMPMLYGEGALKAFTRLQEEIYKREPDPTLFLWTFPQTTAAHVIFASPLMELAPLLALSPAWFCRSDDCSCRPYATAEFFPKSCSYSNLLLKALDTSFGNDHGFTSKSLVKTFLGVELSLDILKIQESFLKKIRKASSDDQLLSIDKIRSYTHLAVLDICTPPDKHVCFGLQHSRRNIFNKLPGSLLFVPKKYLRGATSQAVIIDSGLQAQKSGNIELVIDIEDSAFKLVDWRFEEFKTCKSDGFGRLIALVSSGSVFTSPKILIVLESAHSRTGEKPRLSLEFRLLSSYPPDLRIQPWRASGSGSRVPDEDDSQLSDYLKLELSQEETASVSLRRKPRLQSDAGKNEKLVDLSFRFSLQIQLKRRS